ncbi:alpha/beta fold hydrolase [Streptosporangium lutulentum]
MVGFDPRGVGDSTPVRCLSSGDLDTYVGLDSTPDSPDEVTVLEESSRRFASGCQARSGDLLAHVGTADAARDMDLLRAAVGDSRLTYLGKSYGTQLGAVYADLFPDHVRALVLDGAVDPSLPRWS